MTGLLAAAALVVTGFGLVAAAAVLVRARDGRLALRVLLDPSPPPGCCSGR